MERLVILSAVCVVIALPAMMAAACAFATPRTSRMLRVVYTLWGIRALLGVGLVVFWLLTESAPTSDVAVPSLALWADDVLPDLVLSFRLDRLTALFLAWETLLSACAMRRFKVGMSSPAESQRSAWMYGGMLISIVDLFVLSANLLLTLVCGILISRLCDHLCRSGVHDDPEWPYQEDTGGQAIGDTLRWGELAMWVSLLLSWQFYGSSEYDVLNDPLVQQKIAADNPAAIPVLGLCLAGVTLVFARQFPFVLPFSVRLNADREPTSFIARELMDLSVDCLLRTFLVWPLGFWLLFRLAPVWQQSGVVCQLLGLAGALTAVLAVAIAAVGTDRRAIFSYSSTAYLGLIAMLFSSGSTRAMFAGLMLIGFDAGARLISELVASPTPPEKRHAPDRTIPLFLTSAFFVMLWGGFYGPGFLRSEMATQAKVATATGFTDMSATIFRVFPWITLVVLSGLCWSFLRLKARNVQQTDRDDDDQATFVLSGYSWMVLASMLTFAGIFCTWRLTFLHGVLYPLQQEFNDSFDVSVFIITLSSAAMAAVAVWLLYRLNPEWRMALKKPAEPVLSILRNGAYLPDVWKVLVAQPVNVFQDLCEFCEERAWPTVGRIVRRVCSLGNESFLGGLEHGNMRVNAATVLLTTAVMLGLLMYLEW
ncbi:MAG: proton-conducting transporter membrane subunit [Planctomycetota bacterium]|nr:proton-conducting transporter membrane subunit [Planctomycetota bacterium]MDA1212559.1 proton-conducting transporter membrane subunit [Planctomycetota bacterium]